MNIKHTRATFFAMSPKFLCAFLLLLSINTTFAQQKQPEDKYSEWVTIWPKNAGPDEGKVEIQFMDNGCASMFPLAFRFRNTYLKTGAHLTCTINYIDCDGKPQSDRTTVYLDLGKLGIIKDAGYFEIGSRWVSVTDAKPHDPDKDRSVAELPALNQNISVFNSSYQNWQSKIAGITDAQTRQNCQQKLRDYKSQFDSEYRLAQQNFAAGNGANLADNTSRIGDINRKMDADLNELYDYYINTSKMNGQRSAAKSNGDGYKLAPDATAKTNTPQQQYQQQANAYLTQAQDPNNSDITKSYYLSSAKIFAAGGGNYQQANEIQQQINANTADLYVKGFAALGNLLMSGGSMKKPKVKVNAAEAGYEYYNQGNYDQAFKWFLQAANEGDATSMHNIALFYQYGRGSVKKDTVAAMGWYQKAATAGDAESQLMIGIKYLDKAEEDKNEGQKKSENYQKAVQWLTKAADGGKAIAMDMLGNMYHGGIGVPQDYNMAFQWFNKGAIAGDKDSEFELAKLYAWGGGTKADHAKAFEWMKKSAEDGNYNAMEMLGLMYRSGDKEIPTDYNTAMHWFKAAVDRKNNQAMDDIGYMYENGLGVERDYSQAVSWYLKSANEGNSTAMSDVGTMYALGKGIKQDYQQALQWYEQGANKGNGIAACQTGIMYESGMGIPKNIDTAINWYKKAAELGDPGAMNKLGALYLKGVAVQKNNLLAFKYFSEGADLGNVEAMDALGACYANGTGTTVDFVKARNWFERAAELGNIDAMVSMSVIYNHGFGVPVDEVKGKYWYDKAKEFRRNKNN